MKKKKPIYSTEKGQLERKRIRKRPIGELPLHLKEEIKKLSPIEKLKTDISVSMQLWRLGIDTVALKQRI